MAALPLYISEVTPKEVRGMLGSGVQLSITVGIVLAYLGGMMFTWRNLAFLGALFSLVAAVIITKCPETPRFSLSRGRSQEAAAVLKMLRSPTTNTSEELNDMESSLSGADSSGVTVMELFRRPQFSRPLFVAVTLMVLQQLTGINVVMFYTVSIFEGAGFAQQGEMATVGVGLTQVVMTVVACVFMDRAGRRVLLVVAGLGMAVSFFLLSYYYHTMSEHLHFLPLFALVAYIVFFSLGWGPIPMLVTSEIFPLKARGAACGVASLTNWSVAFIVTKQFSLMTSLLGLGGAFTLFGLCCLCSVMVVLKVVPETRGKSLEEIELHFSQSGGKL